ncbi:MAG TPA: D-alanyl-D-alanine carboxypeptidase family protein [Fimbriimonadaceae bacterium]|nr:D-alanyl-D-alanine carboxypeptidase family protein [Fimbriimonadaceae bacterium]
MIVLAAAARGQHLSAASAIVLDADTGKVLFAKDADTARFPASTTKIMTTLLLLERCKPDDIIVAPPDVEKVKQASMHLKPGERVKVRDMAYALMLRSANDGCYAVACHISGSVEAFAKLMNERAKEIGCTQTQFNNPHGLNDTKHTISARDLALIAREAMRIPTFREIVRTQKKPIVRSTNLEDLVMINKNRLLKAEPTYEGIKTGWTIPAGKCFVGSATRNGYRLLTVVLKSDDWVKDTKLLTDWAFRGHDRLVFFRPGEVVGAPAIVRGGQKERLQVSTPVPGRSVVPKGLSRFADYRMEWEPLDAPVRKGQRVGELVFTDAGGFEQRLPLEAAEDIEPATIAGIVGTTGSKTWTWVVAGGLLVSGAVLMRRKARNFAPAQAPTRRRS